MRCVVTTTAQTEPGGNLMKKALHLSALFALLRAAIAAFPDPRTGKNAHYAMETLGMTAFSTFFLQSPSWRSHERFMRQLTRNGNAARLFGVEELASPTQVRHVLDEVDPIHLTPVFDGILHRSDRSGLLRQMRGLGKDVLIPLDGTRYFSSTNIHCPNCSSTTHEDGHVTYYHTALFPAIVTPGESVVLPLAPEFITPQDGHTKQDCEIMAAKRWIPEFRRRHKTMAATILGDDLYAKQPVCALALAHRLNFVFVCKPESHPTLFAHIAARRQAGDLQTKTVRIFRNGQWELDFYQWACDVPLRAGDDALHVKWVDLTTAVERTGEVVYANSFITNHAMTASTVEAIVAAGRCRWKIENETHNTLKNHGYNLTHNYGHGHQFLSSLLACLMLLALAFHALLDLTQGLFARLRAALPSRREVFADCRALVRYLMFETFHHLLLFMVTQLEWDPAPG
jgi:hypothetical protein